MKKILREFLIKVALFDFYLNLKSELKCFISLRKWAALIKRNSIFLELGSGPKKGSNDWVTVDFSGADISYDLRKGIPLPANSVDRIYSSHMFEHMPYKELIIFINDCYRVLKDNGELSVCVPDASHYIRSYIDGVDFLPKDMLYVPAAVNTGSLIDQINYIAYMDGQHKYMFDSQNLINTLRKAPFSTVNIRCFDEVLDLKDRDHESIYAIAIKKIS